MDRMYEQNQMPHNNEAEQSVLGSIIIDPELINTTPEVCSLVYGVPHQHLRAMMHLNEDNKEIDVVTLMDQLSTEGTLNEAVIPNILPSYLQMYQRREMFSIILVFVSKHALKRTYEFKLQIVLPMMDIMMNLN